MTLTLNTRQGKFLFGLWVILSIICVTILMTALTGCSTTKKTSSQPITASVVSSIDQAQGNLSDIDSKVVSIQKLLK